LNFIFITNFINFYQTMEEVSSVANHVSNITIYYGEKDNPLRTAHLEETL